MVEEKGRDSGAPRRGQEGRGQVRSVRPPPGAGPRLLYLKSRSCLKLTTGVSEHGSSLTVSGAHSAFQTPALSSEAVLNRASQLLSGLGDGPVK